MDRGWCSGRESGRRVMTQQRLDIHQLRLLGGALCLDFINSIENRAGHAPEDFLTTYPDLVRWGEHAGLIAGTTAARLIAQATSDQQAAREALDRALRLRAALHRLFLAIATRS